jgi:hypothetical protein
MAADLVESVTYKEFKVYEFSTYDHRTLKTSSLTRSPSVIHNILVYVLDDTLASEDTMPLTTILRQRPPSQGSTLPPAYSPLLYFRDNQLRKLVRLHHP